MLGETASPVKGRRRGLQPAGTRPRLLPRPGMRYASGVHPDAWEGPSRNAPAKLNPRSAPLAAPLTAAKAWARMERMKKLAALLLLAALPLVAQGEKKDAPAAVKGDPVAGKKLYKAHCALCHFADAGIVKVGPGMKGLFHRKKLPLSGLPVTEENVRQRVAEGTPDPQKPLMPAYKDIFTPREMDDLLAYLKTL